MAAFTRSGARKASEIVMLTFRTLHRSRLAMLSAFAFASATSSSSQRRPRAIDATRSARDSQRTDWTWRIAELHGNVSPKPGELERRGDHREKSSLYGIN